MWRYEQGSGELYWNGAFVSKGYSGKDRGKNNPALQGVQGIGPIPRGRWKIGAPHRSKRTGPYAMNLTPVGHAAKGRSAFQIHGDSVRAPGTASSGCIILGPVIRRLIWESGDHDLEVVE